MRLQCGLHASRLPLEAAVAPRMRGLHARWAPVRPSAGVGRLSRAIRTLALCVETLCLGWHLLAPFWQSFQLFELAEARNDQKCPFPHSNNLDQHPPNPTNNLTHAHNSNILASMDTWEANGTTILHIQHFCLLHTSFLCILRLRSEGPIRPMEAGVGPISRVKFFTNNGPRKPHTEFYMHVALRKC